MLIVKFITDDGLELELEFDDDAGLNLCDLKFLPLQSSHSSSKSMATEQQFGVRIERREGRSARSGDERKQCWCQWVHHQEEAANWLSAEGVQQLHQKNQWKRIEGGAACLHGWQMIGRIGITMRRAYARCVRKESFWPKSQ